MKVLSKLLLLLGVALLATAMMAVSAQAIEITPDNTVVTATTDAGTDPVLTTAGSEVVCEEGTAIGTTGVGSPKIETLSLTFQTDCTVFGFVAASITCVNTVTLEFTTIDGLGGGSATVELDSDFECTITASSCHIEVKGPQNPTSDSNVATNGADTLESLVEVDANVITTCFGGPPTGIQSSEYDATYTIDTPGVVVETGTTGNTDS